MAVYHLRYNETNKAWERSSDGTTYTDLEENFNLPVAIGSFSKPSAVPRLYILGTDGAVGAFPTIGAKDWLVIEDNGNANISFVMSATGSAAIKAYGSGDGVQDGALLYSRSARNWTFYAAGDTTNFRMNIDSNGYGRGCSLYNNANISLTTGVQTLITLNTETDDDYGMHSTVSNTSRIVPGIIARFIFVGTVAFASNATGVRYVQILKNGAVIKEVRCAPCNGDNTIIQAVVEDKSNTTDYYEVAAIQTSGGSINAVAIGSYGLTFQCRQIA